MPLVHLNTGSIMLLVVMLSVRLFACLSVCLSIIYPSVILLLVSAPYFLHLWKLFCNFLILRWYAEFIVITKSVKERHGHTLKYKTWSDEVHLWRSCAHLFVAYREMESASYLCHKMQFFLWTFDRMFTILRWYGCSRFAWHHFVWHLFAAKWGKGTNHPRYLG